MRTLKLTAQRLREVLAYNPMTGHFTRLKTTGTRATLGACGSLRPDGYWCIGIDGVRYLSHRLAWLHMTGEWPEKHIDHRNLNRSDNSWGNLRVANFSQNFANTKKSANNTSGYKGVSWDRSRSRWTAKISVGNKTVNLGRYQDTKSAHSAYVAAAKKYFGEFARAE